jgi:ferric-dicitrate binding protein FerR (iron transport regulator)
MTENLYELLLKKRAGLCTEEEARELDQRIAEDPEARDLWNEINADVHGVWSNPGTDSAWQKLQYSRIHMKPNRIHPTYLKLAAILVGLAVVYALGRTWSKSQGPKPTSQVDFNYSFIELTDGKYISLAGLDRNLERKDLRNDLPLIKLSSLLPEGTQACRVVGMSMDGYRFELMDGSIIRSNANTDFSLDFSSKSKRYLKVDGEMYFEVTPDANRPFQVRTSETQIDVLGTSFNINTYGHTHRIALISGAVKITAGRNSVQLTPGHKAELSADHKLIVSKNNNDAEVAWITGRYTYNNTPVTEVIEQLRYSFGIPIKHYNPESDTTRITGEYHRSSSELEVAQDLATYCNPNYTYMLLRDTMIITYVPGLKKFSK